MTAKAGGRMEAEVGMASSSNGKSIRRLHVSGLNPSQCTIDDIKARFTSFGLAVSDVHNWPPENDAVGNATTWCFVSVTGDDSNVTRAMNLLNGTMWKGSKLRIGNAKQKRWTSAESETRTLNGDGEEGKKKKRRQKVRGVEGIESSDVHTPVTPEAFAKEKKWGWRLSTAGHLVRPMHMRPSHALERPTPVVQEGEQVRRRKRKEEADSAKPPLTRARRITIDPQRYGAVHLSGSMLNDQSDEPLSAGLEWRCVESEDGRYVLWTLVDDDGSVIREESFENAKARPEVAGEEDEGYESASVSSDYSQHEGSTIPDDVDTAIDMAGEGFDSDEEHVLDTVADDRLAKEAEAYDNTFHSAIDMPTFDPDEDDAFSDGYQELKGDGTHIDAMNWAGEKEGHLDLLKRMFGSVESADKMEQPVAEESRSHTSSDELPEEASVADARLSTAGIARRAALMNKAVNFEKDVGQSQFKPILRFDPGQSTETQEDDVKVDRLSDESDGQQLQQPRINKMPSAAEPRQADRVEMTKLTDMFRPKELKDGFSLMADLELDLDDELNFEPDLDGDDDGGGGGGGGGNDRVGDAVFASSQLAPLEPAARMRSSQPARRMNFFPRYNDRGVLDKDGNDAFASILREINDAGKVTQHDQSTYEGKKGAALSQFFVADDAETLAGKWQERKATLTQEYKRRHREALKKKKRKFVGSRNVASTTTKTAAASSSRSAIA